MADNSNQDSGLIRRGLFLLALVGGIAAVVLWILFQRPEQPTPSATKQPEPHVVALVLPNVGFPASLSWTDLGILSETAPSAAGWEVRYNAAIALARLGSAKVNWDVLGEMLSEDAQMRNFRVRLESGMIVPDEVAARRTVLAGLKAVKQWHERQKGSISPAPELQRIHEAVDRLAESSIVDLKKQAEETRNSIKTRKAT